MSAVREAHGNADGEIRRGRVWKSESARSPLNGECRRACELIISQRSVVAHGMQGSGQAAARSASVACSAGTGKLSGFEAGSSLAADSPATAAVASACTPGNCRDAARQSLRQPSARSPSCRMRWKPPGPKAVERDLERPSHPRSIEVQRFAPGPQVVRAAKHWRLSAWQDDCSSTVPTDRSAPRPRAGSPQCGQALARRAAACDTSSRLTMPRASRRAARTVRCNSLSCSSRIA